MTGRRESLGVQWRTEAADHEAKAATHRLMAVEDDVHDRATMRLRNLQVASRHQGMADGLNQAARQLAVESVTEGRYKPAFDKLADL